MASKNDYIVIQCRTCNKKLYNTKLTEDNISGRTAKADLFIPIAPQLKGVDGKAPPVCWSCSSMWVGYTESGVMLMDTTTGRWSDRTHG